MKKTKKTKHTILKGEGANQHTLYGNFEIDTEATEFAEISIKKETKLQHEEPSGAFGEHNTLIVETGDWVAGKQVEYNPFKGTISQIWD